MAHQEFGPKLLSRIMEELSGLAEKDRPERMEGRRFVTVIRPVKGTQPKQDTGNDNKEKVETNNQPSTINN